MKSLRERHFRNPVFRTLCLLSVFNIGALFFYVDSFTELFAFGKQQEVLVEEKSLSLLASTYVIGGVITELATTSAVYVKPLGSTIELHNTYLVIVDSCNKNYEEGCVLARQGPSASTDIAMRLRAGVVLKTNSVTTDSNGLRWYRVAFDEWIRYPERITGDMYVAESVVEVVRNIGVIEKKQTNVTVDKRIVVDRSEQRLYAYDGDVLFREFSISTGRELSPTPRGEFEVYKKMPTRYMQGPLPNLQVQNFYDLPGVPWNLYFTNGGAVIHGAYWHDSFGEPYSNGCVNVTPEQARELYVWATVGTKVLVQD